MTTPDPIPGGPAGPEDTIAIVPFAAEHLAALLDFWVASWTRTLPEIDFEARRPWLVEHLGRLEADGVAIRVASGGAGPIGFVTVDCNNGHLDQLCVAPEFWGKGIAEALVADARRISPSGLHLAVNADNTRAVRFYRRQGFVETGRGSNPRSGLPIVFMSWPGVAGNPETQALT
ncbi:MAG: GNAT family N-acetyltransferase [Ancalomicrobiaceae bacterium]|nr:GNAT family N-acetyltransferase [Ancalomicrobiaceae bacterium]